jgi:hypothetical protein
MTSSCDAAYIVETKEEDYVSAEEYGGVLVIGERVGEGKLKMRAATTYSRNGGPTFSLRAPSESNVMMHGI